MLKRLVAGVATLIAAAMVATAGDGSTSEVELQGKIGCAHCQYHKGSSCAVGLKTADGKIYVLDHASKELMDARYDGGQLKVKGTVSDKEGTLYVHASSAELAK